ncbi:hypothetical protein BO78DRAFT_241740 [Aspergillus sclerotiicarbonarius CBS 121057]|uniref:Uncharacterized protein n=1 Tax=Aspergillus sclerotiicarbonarius (strain CBS 121057 / IBT 28362) TaxID=1448318 RepID=A0A319DVH8_ASPSB|nr:hypothetical protein BO78DRAFT_241740 [Aspergillus sclerotiicarbonarius CBS 121057]
MKMDDACLVPRTPLTFRPRADQLSVVLCDVSYRGAGERGKSKGISSQPQCKKDAQCQSGRAPHPNFLWASDSGAAADGRAFAGSNLTMRAITILAFTALSWPSIRDPPLRRKRRFPAHGHYYSLIAQGERRRPSPATTTTTT